MRALLIPVIVVVLSGCAQWDAIALRQEALAPALTRFRDAQFHSSPEHSDTTKDGKMSLARLFEKRGQSDRAEHYYHALIEENERDPVPHHRLGVIATKQRRFAEAEEHFQTAMQLAPPTAKLFCDMGYAYYLQDKLTDAEEVLKQALELDPNLQTASNNLGLVLGIQGRDDESLSAFKRGVSNAEAHANLAYTRAQRGDLEAAQAGYLYALTLDKTLRTTARALLQVTQRIQMQDALVAAREQVPSQVENEDTVPRLPSITDPPATDITQEGQLVRYEEAPTVSAGEVHAVASKRPVHVDVVPQRSLTPGEDVRGPTDVSASAVLPSPASLAKTSAPRGPQGVQPSSDEQAHLLPPPSNQQVAALALGNTLNSQLPSQSDKWTEDLADPQGAESSIHSPQGFSSQRPSWDTADRYPMARTTWTGITASQAAARSRPATIGTTSTGQKTEP